MVASGSGPVAAVEEIPLMLSSKLRNDIRDVLLQTAVLTLIGVLLIETTLRFAH